MSVFIHIGLPKNASTTLQSSVFPKIKNIKYLGRFYDERATMSHNDDFDQIMRNISTLDSLNYDPTDTKKRLKNYFKQLSASETRFIISQEGLTNNVADRGVVAERLSDVFPDAKIICIIREQFSSLESMYRFLVRQNGENINKSYGKPSVRSYQMWLDDQSRFMSRSYLQTLKYYELLCSYQHLFGKQNLLILPLELLQKDKNEFFKKLFGFLEQDEFQLEMINDLESQNVSPHGMIFNYYKLRNRYSMLGVPKFVPDVVRSILVKSLLSFGKKKDLHMTQSTRLMLEKMYRPNNRLVVEQLGLDLEKYGYLV